MTEREDLIEDLTWIRKRVRNCRGAIESGQVEDKDVRGALLLITDRLDTVLWRMGAAAADTSQDRGTQ
jgi:hypothetical protein